MSDETALYSDAPRPALTAKNDTAAIAAAAPATWTVSNGVSLRHAFNPITSTAGRAAREDSRETQGDRVTYLYSASVRAVPR